MCRATHFESNPPNTVPFGVETLATSTLSNRAGLCSHQTQEQLNPTRSMDSNFRTLVKKIWTNLQKMTICISLSLYGPSKVALSATELFEMSPKALFSSIIA